MKYKLLAIDMDGTFLNEERNITQGNLAAVRKAAEAGLKIVICSGRIPSTLKSFLKDMPENQPIIAGNGSIIFDHNKNEIFSQPLDHNSIFEIVDILRSDYDDVYYQFFNGNVICSEKFDNIIKKFYEMGIRQSRENRLEFRILPDSKKYIEDNNSIVSKFEIYDDDSNLIKEIANNLKKISNIEIVFSGLNAIEITKKGLNKGTSLEILAKHYGYSLDECIAVGNDENDIEMIKRAGLGIAVKNAKDYVKEIADYITKRDNNSDAVAEVVERFIQSNI